MPIVKGSFPRYVASHSGIKCAERELGPSDGVGVERGDTKEMYGKERG